MFKFLSFLVLVSAIWSGVYMVSTVSIKAIKENIKGYVMTDFTVSKTIEVGIISGVDTPNASYVFGTVPLSEQAEKYDPRKVYKIGEIGKVYPKGKVIRLYFNKLMTEHRIISVELKDNINEKESRRLAIGVLPLLSAILLLVLALFSRKRVYFNTY